MATLELEARLDKLLSTAQTETVDIDLFAPIAEREECPICMIPLPLQENEIRFMICCGKIICDGCIYKRVITDKANGKRRSDDMKCAFCFQPPSKNPIKALKKLMKKNISNAFIQMAQEYKAGEDVFQSDTKSLEMYIRAAELGNADAYAKIGLYHEEGIAVEEDMSKAVEYYEVAAKEGCVKAHISLAYRHQMNGNIQNLIEHMKVAASAGHKDSMNGLMETYKDNELSKEELTQTLRAFQASSNELKSKDRDDAQAMNDEAAARLGID